MNNHYHLIINIFVTASIIIGGYIWYRPTIIEKVWDNDITVENIVEEQQDIYALIREVGQFIVLPDEKPTVALVSNLEKLKNQPFFAQAKVGHKLLIYSKAKKAILYDPIAKKIINVSSINVSKP